VRKARFQAILRGSLISLACLGVFAAGAEATGRATRHVETASLFAAVQRRCARLADEKLPPYPWPIAPVHEQHPVRGFFGDPRTVFNGPGEGAFSFHNGVDISAYTGNHVLPVVSGLVVKLAPDRVVVASSFDRRFQYVHLKPLVRLGEWVTASTTVLGLVDPVLHHVHLSEIRGMCVVNPLMPGHLTPFHDDKTPVVASITFENPAGRTLDPDALHGSVRVIAQAFDRPPIPSAPPWGSMPVSPALIRWRLLTPAGRVVMSATAVDFRTSLPPREDFCEVYAPGTEQNFAADDGSFRWGRPGRYLFDLTPDLLDTTILRDGRYRFVVAASNTAGHTGSKGVTIEVRQPREQTEALPRLDAGCAPRSPWAATATAAGGSAPPEPASRRLALRSRG
jgi:hypothetical protein